MNVDESFVASTGWFEHFKKHHDIYKLAITGEQLLSVNGAVAEYLSKFVDKIVAGNYSP